MKKKKINFKMSKELFNEIINEKIKFLLQLILKV